MLIKKEVKAKASIRLLSTALKEISVPKANRRGTINTIPQVMMYIIIAMTTALFIVYYLNTYVLEVKSQKMLHF